MIRFIFTAILIVSSGMSLHAQTPEQERIDRILQQLQRVMDRLDSIETRLSQLENSFELGDLHPAGILILHDIDASSLFPFRNEIRSWCGEPSLTFSVDERKNAIIFQNSTSSTAATIAKIECWIRNVEPGKLKKRTSAEAPKT